MPIAYAQQQEKLLQKKPLHHSLSSPCFQQLEKSQNSNKDPAQPKADRIFFKWLLLKKKKKEKKTRCLGNRDKKDWRKQAVGRGYFSYALIEFWTN